MEQKVIYLDSKEKFEKGMDNSTILKFSVSESEINEWIKNGLKITRTNEFDVLYFSDSDFKLLENGIILKVELSSKTSEKEEEDEEINANWFCNKIKSNENKTETTRNSICNSQTIENSLKEREEPFSFSILEPLLSNFKFPKEKQNNDFVVVEIARMNVHRYYCEFREFSFYIDFVEFSNEKRHLFGTVNLSEQKHEVSKIKNDLNWISIHNVRSKLTECLEFNKKKLYFPESNFETEKVKQDPLVCKLRFDFDVF